MTTAAKPTCGCCATKREGQHKPPLEMSLLPHPTRRQSLKVHACENCDGPVVKLANRKSLPKDLDFEQSTRPEDE